MQSARTPLSPTPATNTARSARIVVFTLVYLSRVTVVQDYQKVLVVVGSALSQLAVCRASSDGNDSTSGPRSIEIQTLLGARVQCAVRCHFIVASRRLAMCHRRSPTAL